MPVALYLMRRLIGDARPSQPNLRLFLSGNGLNGQVSSSSFTAIGG
jgi:hypothetical protein